MAKSRISNMLLVLGAVLLAAVVILEMTGSSSDPLLPASAAFLIGCTAVLDRVGVRELE
ncbi:MAG: hypothetical protein KDE20_12395 [Caldilineaceae bacterium]|nr:hypothetical protein [Caldilineaceae bacterium]MCB9159713.1 hypothetical protein [Caldilineaceae bacterium]